MTKHEVLTPDSPRWRQFIERLDTLGSLGGCNHDHRHAKTVMCNMGGINIDASLAYFEEHGGYCDCEILLNVDQEWSWATHREQ